MDCNDITKLARSAVHVAYFPAATQDEKLLRVIRGLRQFREQTLGSAAPALACESELDPWPVQGKTNRRPIHGEAVEGAG